MLYFILTKMEDITSNYHVKSINMTEVQKCTTGITVGKLILLDSENVELFIKTSIELKEGDNKVRVDLDDYTPKIWVNKFNRNGTPILTPVYDDPKGITHRLIEDKPYTKKFSGKLIILFKNINGKCELIKSIGSSFKVIGGEFCAWETNY